MSELPVEGTPGVAGAARDAARGHVVYLTEHGERLAAIVPAEFAAALEGMSEQDTRELREDLAVAAVTYRVEWRPRARKAFLALDKPVRHRIGEAVDALAAAPPGRGEDDHMCPRRAAHQAGDYRCFTPSTRAGLSCWCSTPGTAARSTAGNSLRPRRISPGRRIGWV
jgi:antitoxin (DNA-binding transcriptional repressor) of toxin-antitoxin stability system